MTYRLWVGPDPNPSGTVPVYTDDISITHNTENRPEHLGVVGGLILHSAFQNLCYGTVLMALPHARISLARA